MNQIEQPHSKRALLIISIATFLGFLDTTLLIPVMSLYAAELGAGVGITGLIIGLYSVSNTPANVLFGRLIDRVGYKLPLIAGLLGDALSMFLYSVSRLPAHLALVRFFHGTSGGLLGPATMSATAAYAGRTQRGRRMGLYGMSLAAATLVGFPLSGFFVRWFNFEALFLFGAGVLVAGALIGLLLPRTGKKNATATKTLPGGGLNKVKDLLKRRGLRVAYISIFAQYFSFGGVVTLLPLYAKGLGMETADVGMLLATFALVFIIVQLPSGALSDRIGRLKPTSIGLGLGIASLVILPFMPTFPLLAAAMALYGLGYGVIFPSISSLVADNTAPQERGMATGVFHALLTAGVAIGAPVMGWVAEVLGIEAGLALSSIVMLLALVTALLTLGRT